MVVVSLGLLACVPSQGYPQLSPYPKVQPLDRNPDPGPPNPLTPPATAMAIRGDTLYRAVETKVEICNLQGVIRQTVSFTEAEGRPVLLDINGNYMAVTTDTGLIKVSRTSETGP